MCYYFSKTKQVVSAQERYAEEQASPEAAAETERCLRDGKDSSNDGDNRE